MNTRLLAFLHLEWRRQMADCSEYRPFQFPAPLLTWWLSSLIILSPEPLVASFLLITRCLPPRYKLQLSLPCVPSYLTPVLQASWKSLAHQWFLPYSLHSTGMNLFYSSTVISLGFQEEKFVKSLPFAIHLPTLTFVLQADSTLTAFLSVCIWLDLANGEPQQIRGRKEWGHGVYSLSWLPARLPQAGWVPTKGHSFYIDLSLQLTVALLLPLILSFWPWGTAHSLWSLYTLPTSL